MKIKSNSKSIFKIVTILFCTVIILILGGKVFASTTATTKKSINLRKKASITSKIITTISKGETVKILKKNAAKSDGYTWHKVKYNSKTGFIVSKYIKTNKSTNNINTTNTIISKKSDRKIDPSKPMVALTFDDGPNGTVTPKILDTLEKYGVVATFFDLGSCMKNYPKVSQRAESIGCEVESHTYSHSNLATLSAKQINSDISKAEKIYEKTLGHMPTMVRAPYGSVNTRVKSTINYPLINWDIDTLDWKSRNKNSIMKEIRKFKNYDGRVILMHGIYSSTLEAVKILIPELQEKGYQFVTVSEMAEYKGVELKAGKLYCNFR